MLFQMMKKVHSEYSEELEERAAIMEFDGGLSRDDAELAAAKHIRSKYNDGYTRTVFEHDPKRRNRA